MPLVAAAVCPQPPVLVPELAAGAAAELDDLRSACDAAVQRLWAAEPRRILVVGADTATREYHFPFHGSFAPWGVPLEVTIGGPARGPALPLGLLMGAWLLRRNPPPGVTTHHMWGVAADTDPDECHRLGYRQRGTAPWALLVMGDGTACRGPKSPGYDDPRAQPYDDAVAGALAGADAEALRGLDPELSAQLHVAGRAPWQVLAGATRAAGHGWRGDLIYYAAPYGVAYFVATWEPA